MARTTGLVTYACVIAWTKKELFKHGVHPPEALPVSVIHDVIATLREEGVLIDETIA